MSFIQPILLLGLPAVLIPVIIHLLNRLRYRTVPWAALMFLLRASRSSTRNARLRHYLVLACRMLLLLFLILALARPVVGGRLGLTLASPPETILLLLDRSLSMETIDARHQLSRREKAIALFKQADDVAGRSRFVLIESALREPRTLATLAALDKLAVTGPTDTGADIPAMLQAALDYVVANQTGRTEIWIASDLQRSNWRPASTAWKRLAAAFDALPQDIRFRVVPMAAPAPDNAWMALQTARESGRRESKRLHLVFEIMQEAAKSRSLPVSLSVNGVLTQDTMSLNSTFLRWNRTLAIGEGPGWGYAAIPADTNPKDNIAFFTFGGETHMATLVDGDTPEATRFILAAAAPAPTLFNQSATMREPTKDLAGPLEATALLVRQTATALSPSDAAALQAFLNTGGCLLLLPPTTLETPATLGVSWQRIERIAGDTPLKVVDWDSRTGPLAATADGRDLPVTTTDVRQRRLPTLADPEAFYPIAAYADGKPFLLRRPVGEGVMYVCTSLPHPDWSNLSEGLILLPMVQRMVREGAARLSATRLRTCGEWLPDSNRQEWQCISDDATADLRWTAGVYQRGSVRVALNRPAYEDEPEALDRAALPQLFGNAFLEVLDDMSQRSTEAVRSEVWPGLLLLAILFMGAEMALLISEQRRQSGAGRRPVGAASPDAREAPQP